MNYNERCKVTTTEKVPGFLGEEEVIKSVDVYPCSKSSLSASEQVDLFGKYTKSAFKLHLQGVMGEINEIEYEGVRRNIFDLKHHRNSTVVIIS